MLTLHQNAVRVTEKQLAKLDLDQWIIEEKFKGIRVWFIWEHGYARLITRGLEDVTSNFPHITEQDWFPDYETLQLDCELYDPMQQDEVVSGWAMTINIDPERTSNCVLKVFDILTLKLPGMESATDLSEWAQIQRKEILKTIPLQGPFELVPWFNADAHRVYYEYILSKGGEGIMLKNRNATYAEGRRQVSRWFKRKKRDMFDVVITGLGPIGEGKFSDGISTVKVSQFVGTELRYICNITVVDSYVRINLMNDPKSYLNKVISVRAMEQDPNSLALIEASWDGSIRCDKRPEECTYDAAQLGRPFQPSTGSQQDTQAHTEIPHALDRKPRIIDIKIP